MPYSLKVPHPLTRLLLNYHFIFLSDSCIQCTSANDQKCNSNAPSLTTQDCPTNATHCYTKITSMCYYQNKLTINAFFIINNAISVHDRNVVRGCIGDTRISTVNVCDDDIYCKSCNNGGGCNNEEYPHNRLNCHICKGDLDSVCGSELKEDASVVCPLYDNNDRCFIRRTRMRLRNFI